MAIEDDFSIATNGDIRHTSGITHYTVLELHRYLSAHADDQQAAGDDLVDITSYTPSARSTDNIIELLDHVASTGPTFNIDDTAAEYFYAGSIKQKGGNELYSGLKVLGSVNNSSTKVKVIQDNDEYQYTTTPASPFWGDQSTGGYNGDSTGGVLLRVMIKSRINGADIDQKQIRVQSRHWGDSYDFFNVTLAEGEAVAALGTTPDAQNDTLQATVQAWAGGDIPTNTEGFQLIDLNNGNGDQEYYSQWTYNTNAQGLKAVWQWGKDITGTGTASTLYGINGEFFIGPSHSVVYDGELTGPFTENEILTWGTTITYDTGVGVPFTIGEYVTIGASGAAGKVVSGGVGASGDIVVALENTAITLLDGDTITGITSGATADINVTIVDNDKSGGTAILLALDDDGATGNFYIQLLTGSIPSDDQTITGRTSGATSLVNITVLAKTLSKVFVGSYTGSLIGAYGLGIDPDDLTASDTVTPLIGATQTPPNNQTFTVFGLVNGEDRVLVAPRSGALLDYAQLTLQTTLSTGTETAVVVTGAIPVDTPQAGTIRIQLDSGIYKYQAYTSWATSTFAIASTDFSGDNATSGNTPDVFIGYIDKLSGGTSEAVALVYNADRDLFVRVRDGGGTPIKTYEASASFTSTGGSATASRITDA